MSNQPDAAINAVVHYKTTDHASEGNTDGSGSGSITFSIGRPTAGYTVMVDVTVGQVLNKLHPSIEGR